MKLWRFRHGNVPRDKKYAPGLDQTAKHAVLLGTHRVIVHDKTDLLRLAGKPDHLGFGLLHRSVHLADLFLQLLLLLSRNLMGQGRPGKIHLVERILHRIRVRPVADDEQTDLFRGSADSRDIHGFHLGRVLPQKLVHLLQGDVPGQRADKRGGLPRPPVIQREIEIFPRFQSIDLLLQFGDHALVLGNLLLQFLQAIGGLHNLVMLACAGLVLLH